jgi:hypothetical protein
VPQLSPLREDSLYLAPEQQQQQQPMGPRSVLRSQQAHLLDAIRMQAEGSGVPQLQGSPGIGRSGRASPMPALAPGAEAAGQSALPAMPTTGGGGSGDGPNWAAAAAAADDMGEGHHMTYDNPLWGSERNGSGFN